VEALRAATVPTPGAYHTVRRRERVSPRARTRLALDPACGSMVRNGAVPYAGQIYITRERVMSKRWCRSAAHLEEAVDLITLAVSFALLLSLLVNIRSWFRRGGGRIRIGESWFNFSRRELDTIALGRIALRACKRCVYCGAEVDDAGRDHVRGQERGKLLADLVAYRIPVVALIDRDV